MWRTSAHGAIGEGRLIWGVNDFDEAAEMPYASTSCGSRRARVLAGVDDIDAADVCESILDGYVRGTGRACGRSCSIATTSGCARPSSWTRMTAQEFWDEDSLPEKNKALKKAEKKVKRRFARHRQSPALYRDALTRAPARLQKSRLRFCIAPPAPAVSAARACRRRRLARATSRARGEGDRSVRHGARNHGSRNRCAARRSHRANIDRRTDLVSCAALSLCAGCRRTFKIETGNGRRGRQTAAPSMRARRSSSMLQRWAAISRRSIRGIREVPADQGATCSGASAGSRQVRSKRRSHLVNEDLDDWRKASNAATSVPPVIASIKENALSRRRRMRQSLVRTGRNAMPRPSVAEKRPHSASCTKSGCFGHSQSVGRRLRALSAGSRLQGAGVDLVGLCVVGWRMPTTRSASTWCWRI